MTVTEKRSNDGRVTRRKFAVSLAAAAAAAAIPGRAELPAWPPIRVRSLNSIGLAVADMAATLEWYQRFFGLPIMYTQKTPEGEVVILALGNGPEHLALHPANGAKPGIKYAGLGVPNFDRKLIQMALDEHKVKGEWTVRKSPQGDVEELLIHDPHDLPIRLQDISYCGGGGRLGNQCPRPWKPAPKQKTPHLPVKTWNHLSFTTPDDKTAGIFLQRVLDLRLKTMDYRQQHAIPIYGIGDTPQTLNPSQGSGGGGFGHFCFGIENFDYDRAAKTLNDLGANVPPAAASRPTCCGQKIVYNPRETITSGAMRDPNGFSVQLTDVRFCAGTGKLGEVCPGGLTVDGGTI